VKARHLSARFGGPRVVAPSALFMKLYAGFVQGSSDYVKEILAQGLWHGAMLKQLTAAIAARNQEQADADAGELAAASEQPADRSEAVHGA